MNMEWKIIPNFKNKIPDKLGCIVIHERKVASSYLCVFVFLGPAQIIVHQQVTFSLIPTTKIINATKAPTSVIDDVALLTRAGI